MKTTQFIKRLFASAFTAVTLVTLASASLTQSAFAAVDSDSLVATDSVYNVPTFAMYGIIEDIYNASFTSMTVVDDGMNEQAQNGAIVNPSGLIGAINNVKIDLSGSVSAAGISNYLDANGELVPSMETPTITTISNVDITVSASTEAYGIYSSEGIINSITGADVSVSSDSGSAYALYFLSHQTTTSFSGNLSATTVSGTATALSIIGGFFSDTFHFSGNSTLSATATDGGAAYALSVAGTDYTLTAASYDTTITLTGDIKVSSKSLTLDSGTYVLSGDSTVTASSLIINEGACLSLKGATTFDLTGGLVLNVEGDVTNAMVSIAEDAEISGLTVIDVYLVDDAALGDWNDDTAIAIMDAASATALEGLVINVYDASGTEVAFGVSASQLAGVSPSSDTDTGSIPEPSTATLSLLALAGLCVRRRRKSVMS